MDKLESLLVDAVNEADTLADGEDMPLIHSVRLRKVRDELDDVLRRVQAMQRQAAERRDA